MRLSQDPHADTGNLEAYEVRLEGEGNEVRPTALKDGLFVGPD